MIFLADPTPRLGQKSRAYTPITLVKLSFRLGSRSISKSWGSKCVTYQYTDLVTIAIWSFFHAEICLAEGCLAEFQYRYYKQWCANACLHESTSVYYFRVVQSTVGGSEVEVSCVDQWAVPPAAHHWWRTSRVFRVSLAGVTRGSWLTGPPVCPWASRPAARASATGLSPAAGPMVQRWPNGETQ